MLSLKHIVFAASLLTLSMSAKAQVGVGTASPDPSAQLEISSSNKGLLIPRIYEADRPLSPATGLMIYQLDADPGFYYFNGFQWQKVGQQTESLKYLGKLQVDIGTTGSVQPVAPNTWDTLTWMTPYSDYSSSLQPDGKKIVVPAGVTKVRISARFTVYNWDLSAGTVAEKGMIELWHDEPGASWNTEFSSVGVSTFQQFLLFNGWNFSSPLLDVQPGDELGIRWQHNGAAARTPGWGSDNNTYLVIEYYQ